MRALLRALLNIAQRTGRFTVVEATAIYNGLWRIIGLALFACLAAFITNAGLGFKTPSLMLAIAFMVAAVYLWAKPFHILVVAGIGGARGLVKRIAADAALADEIEETFKTYLGFLKWVLFVGVTFLLITGTVSFRENPRAMLSILVALSVIGILTWMWPKLFVGTWGRKLLYAFAAVVAALAFGSLIPGPVWTKYTGWDPVTAKPTSADEALYRLKQTRQDMADADRATELNRITAKIQRREALTEAEEQFINDRPQTQDRAAQAPSKRMLSIPANGEVRVRSRDGFGAAFTGEGFQISCVYQDGTEEEGTPSHPCRGDLSYHVVRDTSGRQNLVLYELVQGAS